MKRRLPTSEGLFLVVIALCIGVVLAMLMFGCAAPTRAQRLRSEAEGRLGNCMGHSGAGAMRKLRECRAYVREWCSERGLEADCGEGYGWWL